MPKTQSYLVTYTETNHYTAWVPASSAENARLMMQEIIAEGGSAAEAIYNNLEVSGYDLTVADTPELRSVDDLIVDIDKAQDLGRELMGPIVFSGSDLAF